MFKVPLRASGKRNITIRAVVVETILNGPDAKCPDNLAWRFMQSRNAKPWDLHQPGGVIDICLGMDYPFLQPRHLEKESGVAGTPLHLSIWERPHPVRGGTAQGVGDPIG